MNETELNELKEYLDRSKQAEKVLIKLVDYTPLSILDFSFDIRIQATTLYFHLKIFQRLGLVTITRSGRRSKVELTSLGKKVALICKESDMYKNKIDKLGELEDEKEH